MSRYDVEKVKWDEKSEEMLSERRDWRVNETFDQAFERYNTLRPAKAFLTGLDQPGSQVLDYGCGFGWTTLLLAQKAQRVVGFDISEGSLAVLRRSAEENGFHNIETRAGDGEALPFADQQFDVVFGNAVLHHLRLDVCLPEIARVLKPGGRAAFCEPFAHNPLINAYRYVHHHWLEDHVGTDQPLTYADKALFEPYFSHVEFVESSFLRDRVPMLIGLDRFALRLKPLRRFVAYITVLLEK
jgi:ubiquinone/menaquinone biosynthesis C-methylase UbiE